MVAARGTSERDEKLYPVVGLACWSWLPKCGCMPLQSKEGPVGSNPFTTRSARNFLELSLRRTLVTVATEYLDNGYYSHN